MELKNFEKRYGTPKPESLKSQVIDGKSVTGVDYVLPEDSCLSFLLLVLLCIGFVSLGWDGII